MFPAPQMVPPNTSRPEHASGWPCFNGQISPPLLSAAAHQYKTLGWEETTFLHLGRGTPRCQHRNPTPDGMRTGTSSDTGLHDRRLRGVPRAGPRTDALAGVRNDLMQKENIPIPAGIPASSLSLWCSSEYKHLSPKSDWVARSQV